jgi:hypothetical protein
MENQDLQNLANLLASFMLDAVNPRFNSFMRFLSDMQIVTTNEVFWAIMVAAAKIGAFAAVNLELRANYSEDMAREIIIENFNKELPIFRELFIKKGLANFEKA